MKTSIYVPDELWGKVQQQQPDASASQLLQDCLRSKFDAPAPAFAVLSDGNLAKRDAVLSGLQTKLVSGYQDGYDFGLDLIGALDTFELITLLAAHDFNLEGFKSETDTEEYVIDAEGNYFDFDDWWVQTLDSSSHAQYLWDRESLPAVVQRGIQDAFRHVWQTATVSSPSEGAASQAAPAHSEAGDAAPE